MSQEELAFRADISRTYLSEVERGDRNISVDNMEAPPSPWRWNCPISCGIPCWRCPARIPAETPVRPMPLAFRPYLTNLPAPWESAG
nr:helix-turn-helix transcriptional regulator [Herbaspirillum frisingense]